MIQSFNDKETEKVYKRFHPRRYPENIQRIAFRKLRMINRAFGINDLRVPAANRFEKLKGDRKGQYSIRIIDQWRICFEWKNGDAEKVEIVDYHKG
ncbi:MAG: type II toxin-antitoxin system RelE/ParE family toxin [Deltaproteobacteria bacterium]|jgi:toxin HigB-1|nr:type II toxin-antitoxin system RelE/ParE family toxin [Deltaproteobacteria bacterium]